MTNSDISDYLSFYAKLLDIHGKNSFKVKSYSNAAFQIDRNPIPLRNLSIQELEKTNGIGKTLAQKIQELNTNQKIQEMEDLLAKTPSGILELMKIKGIGPKKIATIWKELQIETPGELLYACNENRLVHYKGFGSKTQQSIKESLEFYFNSQNKYLYAHALVINHHLLKMLYSVFDKETVSISGALRRQEDIIEQFEYVIKANEEAIVDALSTLPDWEYENTEADTILFNYKGVAHIHIYFDTEEDESLLFFTTGTASFNDAFQDHFPDVSFQQTEADIFEEAGIDFIPPYLRMNDTFLNQNKNKQIPKIIKTGDIKGIIHNHSKWSDGANSIEEMALACIERGFEYLVMSDHSVTSFYANGLNSSRVLQQQEEIDKLNEKLAPFVIFKSIECDILGDGSLDYDASILQTFDLVIASVHQNLNMTEEKAMQRILAAVRNPYTTILGHPTGRLLLSRKEYPLQFETLIQECKATNVCIEINANPRRLDLDWTWIQTAMEQEVMLSINPDAHSLEGIQDIEYGILSAQKGGLLTRLNLSSLSLSEFKSYISNRKSMII